MIFKKLTSSRTQLVRAHRSWDLKCSNSPEKQSGLTARTFKMCITFDPVISYPGISLYYGNNLKQRHTFFV